MSVYLCNTCDSWFNTRAELRNHNCLGPKTKAVVAEAPKPKPEPVKAEPVEEPKVVAEAVQEESPVEVEETPEVQEKPARRGRKQS